MSIAALIYYLLAVPKLVLRRWCSCCSQDGVRYAAGAAPLEIMLGQNERLIEIGGSVLGIWDDA